MTFQCLEDKYGGAAAYYVLTEIERAAYIRPSEFTSIDPETRLAIALRAQDCLIAAQSAA